jgi:hypothetical protein
MIAQSGRLRLTWRQDLPRESRAMLRHFALCALTLTAPPAWAGPLVDAATTIEAKLSAGDFPGALDDSRALMAQVWDQSPGLTFGQALLVAENATGFGVFNPRANNVFKQGDPILIYCEPFGFGYGAPGDGLYSVNFIVDLQVLDASGNQLANAEGATEYNMTSRHQNREVQANITYSLDGIPVGRYTLITTLRDKNSAKSGAFQTAIEISE